MSTTGSRKKRHSHTNLRKPFDPAVLSKARALAASYQVLIWFEGGEYFGRGLELPFTLADGKTPEDCFETCAKQ